MSLLGGDGQLTAKIGYLRLHALGVLRPSLDSSPFLLFDQFDDLELQTHGVVRWLGLELFLSTINHDV